MRDAKLTASVYPNTLTYKHPNVHTRLSPPHLLSSKIWLSTETQYRWRACGRRGHAFSCLLVLTTMLLINQS